MQYAEYTAAVNKYRSGCISDRIRNSFVNRFDQLSHRILNDKNLALLILAITYITQILEHLVHLDIGKAVSLLRSIIITIIIIHKNKAHL